jgi:hypothetical protein
MNSLFINMVRKHISCPICGELGQKDFGAHVAQKTQCFLVFGIMSLLPDIPFDFVIEQFSSSSKIRVKTITLFFLGRLESMHCPNKDSQFLLAYINFMRAGEGFSGENQERSNFLSAPDQFVRLRSLACTLFFLSFWNLAYPNDSATINLFKHVHLSSGKVVLNHALVEGFRKVFVSNSHQQHAYDCSIDFPKQQRFIGTGTGANCDNNCSFANTFGSVNNLAQNYEQHFTTCTFLDTSSGVLQRVPRHQQAPTCIWKQVQGGVISGILTLENVLRTLVQVNADRVGKADLKQNQLSVHTCSRNLKPIFILFKIFMLGSFLSPATTWGKFSCRQCCTHVNKSTIFRSADLIAPQKDTAGHTIQERAPSPPSDNSTRRNCTNSLFHPVNCSRSVLVSRSKQGYAQLYIYTYNTHDYSSVFSCIKSTTCSG